MAFTYQEFDTTAANLTADLKTKILLSTDYSNPTGSVVKATTPLGATIAMDLVGGGASDTQIFKPTIWRLWVGTPGAGTDSLLGRWVYFKRAAGATSEVLHVRVAAGNTLLYIDIEGPRTGETNADGAYGSVRQMVAIGELTPYFAGDTQPTVVAMGSTSYNNNSTLSSNAGSGMCHVGRDQANVSSWAGGHLATLCSPYYPAVNAQNRTFTPYASDGSSYLAPYVLFEDIAGIRGRLTDLFYAGWYNSSNPFDAAAGYAPGDIVSYGGKTYKILAPFRASNLNAAEHSVGSLGGGWNGTTTYTTSPLVAVRTA